ELERLFGGRIHSGGKLGPATDRGAIDGDDAISCFHPRCCGAIASHDGIDYRSEEIADARKEGDTIAIGPYRNRYRATLCLDRHDVPTLDDSAPDVVPCGD